MGVIFLCPVHRTHYIGVWFANPVDGGPPASADALPAPRWQRTGDTIETLTLTPSVDAQPGNPSCWHGFITNGAIT